MRLPYNDLWNDAVALVRSHRTLLIALAGAFFFLPNLAVAVLGPLEAPPPGVSFLEAMAAYTREHWPLLLVAGLVQMLGTLTMLRLFLQADGRTVGATIGASLALLPTLFVAGFVANLLIVFGLMLLVVPGVYALGRLAPMPAALVAEHRRNPFDALARSFALTTGHGFAVAGLFAIVYILLFLIDVAVTRGLGSIAILLAGQEIGMLIAEIGSAFVWAAANVLLVALTAIVYLRLSAAAPASASR